MQRGTLAGLAMLGLAALGAPAPAQSTCALREALTRHLTDRFGEVLSGGGLRSESQLLEVWSSPDTGTWTVLLTGANGISCIMATGTDWHQQVPKRPLKDVPS